MDTCSSFSPAGGLGGRGGGVCVCVCDARVLLLQCAGIVCEPLVTGAEHT